MDRNLVENVLNCTAVKAVVIVLIKPVSDHYQETKGKDIAHCGTCSSSQPDKHMRNQNSYVRGIKKKRRRPAGDDWGFKDGRRR